MITGVVNTVLEATLQLQISGPMGQTVETTVIDTGYNGALTLPVSVITTLGLLRLASRSVTLGDTTRRTFDFYEATVNWDGQHKIVPVLNVEGDPLIGTALLKDYKLDSDFVIGGHVRISALP